VRVPGGENAASDPSFFLSETWLDACLLTWPGHAAFERVELSSADGTSGHVLLGRGTSIRQRFMRVPYLAINQSADPFLDEATIELNGIFGCPPDAFDRTFRLLLARLDADASWREVRFFGLARERADRVERLASEQGLRCRLFSMRPTYWVDLDSIRSEHGSDYLASRSANTRAQLRRSLRRAERELGPVRLLRAESVHEALAWLDALAPLHRARWPSGAQPVGFDNPLFVEFHRNLIASGFGRGTLDLLRLDAGDASLAYLYNFRLAGHSYFYLAGIDYDRAEAYRPGMIAHWFAIERSLRNGDRIYDFLAGEHVYKRRLASDSDVQHDCVLWRPTVALRLEDMLRSLRRRWRERARRSRTGD
jgi:hypothetical protein